MAPEVYEEKYSTKADIWSVGCVAFQMATGTPPWTALGYNNPVSLFQYISKVNGPPTMDIDESDAARGIGEGKKMVEHFKTAVASCFRREPEKRPSARELLSHVFFSIDHIATTDDDADTSVLFSPLSALKPNNSASPVGGIMSPIPFRMKRRSNSFEARRSPFLSPPLLQSASKRLSRPPLSPQPDTSDWPTWAREKLHTDNIDDISAIQNSMCAMQLDSLAYSLSPRNTSPGSAPLEGLDYVSSISSSLAFSS